MHTPRITNGQLFVTVLSACLGLLVTGVPSQVYALEGTATTRASGSQPLVVHVSFERLAPKQARRPAAVSNSYFQAGVCRAQNRPAEIFYQNTRALTATDQVLVVTRLPRAGLSALLAEQPIAN